MAVNTVKRNQAFEAEQSVLGAILVNPDVLSDVSAILLDDSHAFEYEPHRHIFEAMLDIAREGTPLDVVLLNNRLDETGHADESGGASYLSDLSGVVPTSACATDYAKIVRESHLRREVGRRLNIATEAHRSGKPLEEIVALLPEKTERKQGGNLVLLSDVQPERVEWLWYPYLPRGKMVILEGDPGLGKSTITLDIVARVSNGRAFPESQQKRTSEGVVILSGEDGLQDTIRPRLDAAGAEADRIIAITGIPDADGHERPLSIPGDLPTIKEAIGRVDAALVVIDPLMAFLGGGVDAHRDQDVRRALHPLAAMADETGAVVLVVRHLNKSAGKNAIYRGGGSIGFAAAARAVFVVGRDPEDEDRRILACTKANLGPEPLSLAYRLDVDPDRDVSRVQWLGTTGHSANDLLAQAAGDGKGALDEATAVLMDILQDGPVPCEKVKERAKRAGVYERTLYRAKSEIGAISKKIGKPGEKGCWMWRLPEDGQSGAKMANVIVWPPSQNVGNLRKPRDDSDEGEDFEI